MSEPVQIVAETTGDLRAGLNTSENELTQARIVVATAVITGQQSDFFEDESTLTPPVPDEATLAAIQAAVQQVPPNPALRRVFRRAFATRISPIPKLGVVPGAGRATATHGPFLDTLDRPVWIDEFGASPLIAIQRLGASAPFLYFPDAGFTGTTNTLPLSPGSIWIPASEFDTNAPQDGFIGLRIRGGFVKFGRPMVFDGSSPILVPQFGPIFLSVDLDVPLPSGGTGPGVDAGDAVVLPPTNAVFLFEASGATLNAAADASLTAFGAHCKLTFSAAPAAFDFILGRLGFPFAHDATTFPMANSQSTLVVLSGEAVIASAQWSVPVTTATPETLGEAQGAGGLALSLASGIEMRWAGHDIPADCGDCELVADPGTLTLAGLVARTTTLPHTVSLWANAPPSTLTLRFPTLFPFRFVTEAIGSETFGLKTAMFAVLDQPRTIINERSRLEGDGFFVLQQTSAGTLLIAEASAAEGVFAPAQSYAIRNALLKASPPKVLGIAGGYKDSSASTGALDLECDLSLLVPTLPDPYTTNLAFDPASVPSDSRGTMSVLLHWDERGSPTIDVQLPPKATERTVRLPQTPGPPPDPADAQNLAALRQKFELIAPLSEAAISLLDLSTNASQFGVSFDPTLPPPTVIFSPPVLVQDLFVQAKAPNVHVLTLPAVEWEPVFTQDQSIPFPSPLTFAESGGISELAVDMVTLVPVAPLPAIQGFVKAYNFRRPAPTLAVRFTLPFGMTAVAVLRGAEAPGAPSPSFFQIAPDFKTEGVAGGEQLSIRAEPNPVVGGESPTLPGATVQLHDARFGGQPIAVTVLTAPNAPIENTFNNDFGPLGHTPRVPVTRIDISGFGESLFNDWKNSADGPIISKVRFDVIAGRTAREIVQISTVLYPYAVRVVRTITVERQNGASVVRRDSGWQATSDGVYVYPTPAQLPSLITHPGVVDGVVNVTNIRDTGQTFTTSDQSQLMAVRFDCAVLMQNLVAGGDQQGVPARDQLGYVQITDPTQRGVLSPDQYAELLRAVGILGGRIDCIIDIGGSGQRMRVQQVGVAASQNVSAPEFVMGAWGSPVMPGGGQWSFVRKPIAAESPQPLDADQGVPLIRQGPAGAPPVGPYRFTDPADLFRADSPETEYSILHSTGTQRLLFPLPKIEASAPFAITSVRPPVLADPYALATALGLFPRIDACTPFPDASYQLVIGSGGQLRLQQQAPTFAAPTLKRILRDSNTVRSIAYISDPHPPEFDPKDTQPPSFVTVSIDTAAPVPWSLSITRADLAFEAKGKEANRITGTIVSAANTPTQLTDMRFLFGPVLDDVLKSLPLLGANRTSPSPIAMTNEAALHGGIKMDFKKWAEANGGNVAPQVKDLELTMLWQIAPSKSLFDIKFEITLAINSFTLIDPELPIFGNALILLGNLQFEVRDAGNFYTLQLGGGLGIGAELPGKIQLLGFAALTIFGISGTDTFAVGATLLLKGDADAKVVDIEVSAEAKLFVLHVECQAANVPTTWLVGQLTLAIEITLAFFLDIEVDVQWKTGGKLEDGPCELPDDVS